MHRSTRRAWLAQQGVVAAALVAPRLTPSLTGRWQPDRRSRAAPSAERLAPGLMQTLALQAVDAAKVAGAQYADARLTRTVFHYYNMGGDGQLEIDQEMVGIGVRALVNGYWGFAASPYWLADETARLGRAAVAIAMANARGPQRTVEFETVPAVTGTWATPVAIDPFTVPIEEKLDHVVYWKDCAAKLGFQLEFNGITSYMAFGRQERVLATSGGTLVTQTLYESGGLIKLVPAQSGVAGAIGYAGGAGFLLPGLGWAGKGWELFADIPDRIEPAAEAFAAQTAIGTRPATVGRYTLVCDGATMASLVSQTLGPATQLDRALGYEADAGGTSFLDDPLTMVGTLSLASPLITLTINRSAPAQLATAQWDDEGTVPTSVPLIKGGVLVDFQTTRESAGWLAPYYRRQGKSVQSHGCAGADNARSVTLLHMPNLALAPSPLATELTDLVADVKTGLLIEGGEVTQMDFQARNGLLYAGEHGGRIREIRNGRLGTYLNGGAVMFNTLDLWKHTHAVGGSGTQATVGFSRYDPNGDGDDKGQPAQRTSFSVSAAAAVIPNQPLINLERKA